MPVLLSWEPWKGGHWMVQLWRWVRLVGCFYLLTCAVLFFRALEQIVVPRPEVTIPSVVGKQQSDASKLLEADGLIVHPATGERSDAIPRGGVLSQSLPPGMIVRAGRHIHLAISDGPLHVTIPQVQGQSSSNATQVLANLGLAPSISSSAHSATMPQDRVIQVIPFPGTRVEVGTTVGLVISDGPAGDDEIGDGGIVDRPASRHRPTGGDHPSGQAKAPGPDNAAGIPPPGAPAGEGAPDNGSNGGNSAGSQTHNDSAPETFRPPPPELGGTPPPLPSGGNGRSFRSSAISSPDFSRQKSESDSSQGAPERGSHRSARDSAGAANGPVDGSADGGFRAPPAP